PGQAWANKRHLERNIEAYRNRTDDTDRGLNGPRDHREGAGTWLPRGARDDVERCVEGETALSQFRCQFDGIEILNPVEDLILLIRTADAVPIETDRLVVRAMRHLEAEIVALGSKAVHEAMAEFEA